MSRNEVLTIASVLRIVITILIDAGRMNHKVIVTVSRPVHLGTNEAHFLNGASVDRTAVTRRDLVGNVCRFLLLSKGNRLGSLRRACVVNVRHKEDGRIILQRVLCRFVGDLISVQCELLNVTDQERRRRTDRGYWFGDYFRVLLLFGYFLLVGLLIAARVILVVRVLLTFRQNANGFNVRQLNLGDVSRVRFRRRFVLLYLRLPRVHVNGRFQLDRREVNDGVLDCPGL